MTTPLKLLKASRQLVGAWRSCKRLVLSILENSQWMSLGWVSFRFYLDCFICYPLTWNLYFSHFSFLFNKHPLFLCSSRQPYHYKNRHLGQQPHLRHAPKSFQPPILHWWLLKRVWLRCQYRPDSHRARRWRRWQYSNSSRLLFCLRFKTLTRSTFSQTRRQPFQHLRCQCGSCCRYHLPFRFLPRHWCPWHRMFHLLTLPASFIPSTISNREQPWPNPRHTRSLVRTLHSCYPTPLPFSPRPPRLHPQLYPRPH